MKYFNPVGNAIVQAELMGRTFVAITTKKGEVAFLLHKKRKCWYVEKEPDFYSFEIKVRKVAYSIIKSALLHRADMFKK
jgi:hypothetical protein